MKSLINTLACTVLFAKLHDEFDGSTGGGGTTATAPNAWMSENGMTPIDIRINGVSGIKYAQPATVEKYDELAKLQGRCLSDACSKHLFHSSYGDIRAAVTAALVKAGYNKPRLFATAKKIVVTEVFEGEGTEAKLVGYIDDKGKKYPTDLDPAVEPDKAYFDRVCAENSVEPSHFAVLVQEAADSVPFSPSRKTRTAGPRKIAKAYIAAAQGIIDAGAEAIAAATAQLSELLDRPLDTSDAESRLFVLSSAIADAELKEKRENEAKLATKYSG